MSLAQSSTLLLSDGRTCSLFRESVLYSLKPRGSIPSPQNKSCLHSWTWEAFAGLSLLFLILVVIAAIPCHLLCCWPLCPLSVCLILSLRSPAQQRAFHLACQKSLKLTLALWGTHILSIALGFVWLALRRTFVAVRLCILLGSPLFRLTPTDPAHCRYVHLFIALSRNGSDRDRRETKTGSRME